jgi:RNA polymerase sigma-70 factor (ECF subfamily)
LEAERELVNQARKGDTAALAELLRQNYAFLVKYLIKVTLDPHAAEDTAQETMLKAVEKIRLFDGRSKFSTWLIAIATRLYIDNRRKKRRERDWLEREGRQSAEPSAQSLRWRVTMAGGEWSDVLDAVSRLTEEVRMPVILKHYYGYTQEEIADMMGIPEGTVKSRIHNGLKTLRKELTDGEPEESNGREGKTDNRGTHRQPVGS